MRRERAPVKKVMYPIPNIHNTLSHVALIACSVTLELGFEPQYYPNQTSKYLV